jgi:hypothetical protein
MAKKTSSDFELEAIKYSSRAGKSLAPVCELLRKETTKTSYRTVDDIDLKHLSA